MNAERVVFLDLQTLYPGTDGSEPWKTWAFVKGMDALQRLPWNQFHLVSLWAAPGEEERVKDLADRGLITSFEQAARFIADLADGRAAPGAAYRLCLHLHGLSGERDPFSAEREAFARQFAGPEPAEGIKGFLNKVKAPFGQNPKIREGLRDLSAWLSR